MDIHASLTQSRDQGWAAWQSLEKAVEEQVDRLVKLRPSGQLVEQIAPDHKASVQPIHVRQYGIGSDNIIKSNGHVCFP